MSKTILPCRRFCCARKAKARTVQSKVNQQSPIKNHSFHPKLHQVLSPQSRKLSNQSIHSDVHIPWNNEGHYCVEFTSSNFQTMSISIVLTKEYLQTINEYRFSIRILLSRTFERTNRSSTSTSK